MLRIASLVGAQLFRVSFDPFADAQGFCGITPRTASVDERSGQCNTAKTPESMNPLFYGLLPLGYTEIDPKTSATDSFERPVSVGPRTIARTMGR
jgi:hypothetical protein